MPMCNTSSSWTREESTRSEWSWWNEKLTRTRRSQPRYLPPLIPLLLKPYTYPIPLFFQSLLVRANPIIRNETASFHGLVWARLFILTLFHLPSSSLRIYIYIYCIYLYVSWWGEGETKRLTRSSCFERESWSFGTARGERATSSSYFVSRHAHSTPATSSARINFAWILSHYPINRLKHHVYSIYVMWLFTSVIVIPVMIFFFFFVMNMSMKYNLNLLL